MPPVLQLSGPMEQNQMESDSGLVVGGPCHMKSWCIDIIREQTGDLRYVVLTKKEKEVRIWLVISDYTSHNTIFNTKVNK